MRCDINISVSQGSRQGNRVEIKNVLGIKFVEKAIEHELLRHVALIEAGQEVTKETRRYDTLNDVTYSMRSKEQDPDYRFLQEPDLPCFVIRPERVERVRSALGLTPFERKRAYASTYNLPISDV